MDRRIAALSLVVTCAVSPVSAQAPLAAPEGARTAIRAAATPRQPVAVRVSPGNSFAPSQVQAMVHVERDSRNRLLTIEIDSESYYRASEVQLDGEAAARSHILRMQDLPPGLYSVVVTIYRAHEPRIEARARFTVL